MERAGFVGVARVGGPSSGGARRGGRQCARRARVRMVGEGADGITRVPQGSLTERLASLSFGYERLPELSPAVRGNAAAPADADGCGSCRVRWVCARGHVIHALAGSESTRHCPTCNVIGCPLHRHNSSAAESPPSTSLSLDIFKALARLRGGECVSSTYSSVKKKLRFRCGNGHTWECTAENIRRGSWCPTCAYDSRRSRLSDMHNTAAAFGGRCLSTEYVNNKTKLKWMCAAGHVFEMSANNVRRFSGDRKPSWCKHCRALSAGGAKRPSTARTNAARSGALVPNARRKALRAAARRPSR